MSGEPNWVTVAPCGAIGDGEILAASAEGKPIALYNIDGDIYATDGLCTHALAYLSDGWLDGDVIECPLHAGRFEIKTGKGLGPPIPCDIKTYKTRVLAGEIQIDIAS